MLFIYIYITRLASNEIFSPSNKIHREVGWAKDLSAPLYILHSSNTSERMGKEMKQCNSFFIDLKKAYVLVRMEESL